MMNNMQWNDRFNIGVDIVDKAHQRLFSIVLKMIELNEDSEKREHACRETIKYFKSYTVKHFAEEEAYMKSINYSGYDMHKRLHDNMKNKTIPALEEELEEQKYSEISVQHFLGICIGWLTGHIMIEDCAITGRNFNKWVYNSDDEDIYALEKAISEVMRQVFGIELRLVSERYGGEDFGKGVFYRFTYRSQDNEKFQIFMAFEEKLIIYMISEILGKQLHKIDKTVVYAVKQLSLQLVKRVGVLLKPLGTFKLEKEDVMNYEQILLAFEKEYPPYSLLFGTGGNGYFAFCVKKQKTVSTKKTQ